MTSERLEWERLLVVLGERKVRDRDMIIAIEAAMVEYAMRPVPLLLWCPQCNARHIDTGEFATKSHHTHACQTCGHVWRPAIVPTVGVQFLPGFKNQDET